MARQREVTMHYPRLITSIDLASLIVSVSVTLLPSMSASLASRPHQGPSPQTRPYCGEAPFSACLRAQKNQFSIHQDHSGIDSCRSGRAGSTHMVWTRDRAETALWVRGRMVQKLWHVISVHIRLYIQLVADQLPSSGALQVELPLQPSLAPTALHSAPLGLIKIHVFYHAYSSCRNVLQTSLA